MALSVEDCLADQVLPNSNGWGPSLNPVWGFNSEGDPATGSYAYIDTAIRAADIGPTGAIGPHYPSYAALDNTSFVNPSETVQKFPWFVIDDAYQKRNVSTNTRVQMADMGHIAMGLDGSILQYDTDTMHRSLHEFGSWYWFWGDLTIVIADGSALDQARLETDGFSIGAVGMPAYSGIGWCIHGFPLPVFSRSRNTWVSSVAGTIVYCRARLILHDGGGVDDRNNSGLMLNLGADYSVPGVRMIGASMHNRWKQITNDWQWFYCTDLPASFLRANPPSGWTVGSAPAPSPSPSPTPTPAPAPAPATVVPTAQRWWAPTHGWLAKSAPARPVMTTTSLTSATAGTSGTQSVAASGPGTVTFAAVGLPSGAVLDPDGTLTWDTSLVAAVYTVTITPTSSDTGAGMPVAYQWTVLPAGTASDPGAWAPHLRKRLA